MYIERYETRNALVKYPVCRFVVQSLNTLRGRAKSDFHIDLVLSVDGLLTLVKSVYGILKKHQQFAESYRTFNWRLHFHGDVFTLADPDIHHFHLLRYPIYNGQSGWFEGSNVSFRFSVTDVHAAEIFPSQIGSYPRIKVVAQHQTLPPSAQGMFTDLMEDDWLSDESKIQAREFSNSFREYLGGANVWRQDTFGEFYRDRPHPAKWSKSEEDVLILLIQSGYKFQESWLNVLHYAFLNRSEVGTARQWYKIRRRENMAGSLESNDKEKRDGNCVVKAKALCSKILESHLRAGVPELGEDPRKRKLVTESSESTASSNTALGCMLKRRKVSFSPSTIETEFDDHDRVTQESLGGKNEYSKIARRIEESGRGLGTT